MSLGRKILLTGGLYLVPIIVLYGSGLGASGTISLVIIFSAVLAFFYMFFRLLGFNFFQNAPGRQWQFTKDRQALPNPYDNRIMQMPRYARMTTGRYVLECALAYVVIGLIFAILVYFF